jgi:hypothetical protein
LISRGLRLALTLGACSCTEDWDFAFGGGAASGGGPTGPACARAADCEPPLVCCAEADGRSARCEASCEAGVVLQCAGPTDCVASLCCAWALDAPVTGTQCADTCDGVELCTPTMNDCSDGISNCAPHPVLDGSYCSP